MKCGYAEIIQSLNANQYIEVAIQGSQNIQAHYEPADASKPALPSVITTIYQLQ